MFIITAKVRGWTKRDRFYFDMRYFHIIKVNNVIISTPNQRNDLNPILTRTTRILHFNFEHNTNIILKPLHYFLWFEWGKNHWHAVNQCSQGKLGHARHPAKIIKPLTIKASGLSLGRGKKNLSTTSVQEQIKHHAKVQTNTRQGMGTVENYLALYCVARRFPWVSMTLLALILFYEISFSCFAYRVSDFKQSSSWVVQSSIFSAFITDNNRGF